MEIFNLNGCEQSLRYYGGAAGRKEGILIGGEPWIAKFPQSTRDMGGKNLPSYTSSPISEYLGSHIYQILGIAAHETVLGLLRGKIVCACKDFTYPGKELVEFKNLKNSSPEDIPSVGSPCDGDAVYLHDVLATISAVPPLVSTPGVVERFWDMFVVDAFIKNPDRNNGNWGLLRDSEGGFSLAPVYDNGSCLFDKRSAAVAAARLDDAAAIEQDAFGTNVSRFRLVDEKTGESHAIRPFEYMSSSENPDLDAAIVRIVERVDMDAIGALIDDIPEEAYGLTVMDRAKGESHKRLLAVRYERGLLSAAKEARARMAAREGRGSSLSERIRRAAKSAAMREDERKRDSREKRSEINR